MKSKAKFVHFYIHEKAFENVVCEMEAISLGLNVLSRSSAAPGNDIEVLLACLMSIHIVFYLYSVHLTCLNYIYKFGKDYIYCQYSATPNLALNIAIQMVMLSRHWLHSRHEQIIICLSCTILICIIQHVNRTLSKLWNCSISHVALVTLDIWCGLLRKQLIHIINHFMSYAFIQDHSD